MAFLLLCVGSVSCFLTRWRGPRGGRRYSKTEMASLLCVQVPSAAFLPDGEALVVAAIIGKEMASFLCVQVPSSGFSPDGWALVVAAITGNKWHFCCCV
jgi:hypothetical protein